jgi:chromatin remodeling complex protein RSC6
MPAKKTTDAVPSTTVPSTPVSKSTKPVAEKQVTDKTPEKQVAKPDEKAVTEEAVADVADIDSNLAEQSVEFLAKLQQMGTYISALKTEYRALEKKWARELKAAQKLSTKRKRKAGNRAPSGFVKPTRISDELAKFLEKPSGCEMARTEVTRDINKYIRSNNLQDKENGRKINPDTKLATLLKLKKTDELTYFNLQRYMSPHFAKAVKEVAAAVVA